MAKQCVFYDYELKINRLKKYKYILIHLLIYAHSSRVGGWSTEGVKIINELSDDTMITCHSTHLTSFAVLVSPQDERPVCTAVLYLI